MMREQMNPTEAFDILFPAMSLIGDAYCDCVARLMGKIEKDFSAIIPTTALMGAVVIFK